MSNRRKASEAGKAVRRLATAHPSADDVQPDADGLVILDPPGMSWRGRYAVAMSRYALTFWVAPHLSRYIDRVLYIAVIVDDVLRRVYRDHRIGTHMDYGAFFERYARQVEAVVDGGDEADLERVWHEHAERLLAKYGNPTEAWMRDRPAGGGE